MRIRIQITKVIAFALVVACADVALAEHGQIGSAPEPDTIPATVPEEKAALEAHASKRAEAATADAQKTEAAGAQSGEGHGRYVRSKDGEGERK
jgi:hypothetical protein